MNNKKLLEYNQAIFDINHKKYSKQECFQLGFFNGQEVLFLGINPGIPYTKKLREEVDVVIEQSNFDDFQKDYERVIKITKMGIFMKQVIGDDWSEIGLTNIVKIATSSNRLPTSKLVEKFLPITKKQIDLLQPKIVLCLGKFVGSFFDIDTFYDSCTINNSRYILIPHPSYLFRMGMIDNAIIKIKNILNNINKTCKNEFLKPTQLTLFT